VSAAGLVSATHSSHPWMTMAGAAIYLGLAGMSAAAWSKARGRALARAWLWGALAMTQVFLATDALLGIRLLIAQAGREFFREHGWYGEHRYFQAVLAAAMLMAMGAFTWVALHPARRSPLGCRLAIGGALLSLLMFLLACISLHSFEVWLDWPGKPLGMGTMARVGGCALMGIGGWQFHRRAGEGNNTKGHEAKS
jgi:hypothetical protein